MLKFIFKRFINALVTIFIVITFVFFLIKLTPGNPFASEKTPIEAVRALEHMYGFDRNLVIQYLDYLKHIFFHFDFGMSTKNVGVSVNSFLFPEYGEGGFFLSIKFGIIVMIISTLLGIFLGIFSAIKVNGIIDRLINIFSIIGITFPTIVTGPLLVLFFSVFLNWFPSGGWEMNFKSLFLPVVVLSFPNICMLAQIQRDSFFNIMQMPFITTAKAKGLPKSIIFFKHALKPSLIPSISFLGPTTASVLSGTVIVEKIFGFPGMGTLTINAAINRDYNMILALVIIYSSILIFCNLIVDIMYGFLDPKIKIK